MEKDKVITEIEEAFNGVVLGDGIGLWQAQAIDDYEVEKVQRKNREKDRKEDWQSFDAEELQRCHSSLSFFDADGMRFHLPAYMIQSMDGLVDDPIFHLTYLDSYGSSRFLTLFEQQKKAVVVYLEWCLDQDVYEFDHKTIESALEDFWYE